MILRETSATESISLQISHDSVLLKMTVMPSIIFALQVHSSFLIVPFPRDRNLRSLSPSPWYPFPATRQTDQRLHFIRPICCKRPRLFSIPVSWPSIITFYPFFILDHTATFSWGHPSSMLCLPSNLSLYMHTSKPTDDLRERES